MAEAYLYEWCPGAQKWALRDVCKSEAEAREEGRLLWRGGAAGIKIDAVVTVVEEKRGNN